MIRTVIVDDERPARPAELKDRILASVEDFTSGTLRDDMTLVVTEVV
jgi:serine phosphatase RsbU (regulator of sigma subunit)